jgi:hypothetical protein
VDLIDSISITPAKRSLLHKSLRAKKRPGINPGPPRLLSAHFKSAGLVMMVMPMVVTVMDSGVRRNNRSHQNNQRNSRKQQRTQFHKLTLPAEQTIVSVV